MSSLKLLLIGSVCVGIAAIVCFNALTGPQNIPSASGRSAVRDVRVATSSEVTSPADESVPVDASLPVAPIDEYRATLNQSEQYLRSVNGYTATFNRQIRKRGELHDLEEISIKIRHVPFSVYMIWNGDGQQALYVDGENDGKVLARATRGFFRRTVKLAPTSRIAMADSRYPIYELGLLALVENAQEVLAACPSASGIHVEVESTELDGQSVRQFTITFDSPEMAETYSSCVFCFTEDNPMPIWISSNGWTDEGEPGELIEHYSYRDLVINPGLTDLDFDREAYEL